jgi:hypothetical protein
MNMPFRRSKPRTARLLQAAAVGAGMARLAVRQRTLHPHLVDRKSGNRLMRAVRRG